VALERGAPMASRPPETERCTWKRREIANKKLISTQLPRLARRTPEADGVCASK